MQGTCGVVGWRRALMLQAAAQRLRRPGLLAKLLPAGRRSPLLGPAPNPPTPTHPRNPRSHIPAHPLTCGSSPAPRSAAGTATAPPPRTGAPPGCCCRQGQRAASKLVSCSGTHAVSQSKVLGIDSLPLSSTATCSKQQYPGSTPAIPLPYEVLVQVPSRRILHRDAQVRGRQEDLRPGGGGGGVAAQLQRAPTSACSTSETPYHVAHTPSPNLLSQPTPASTAPCHSASWRPPSCPTSPCNPSSQPPPFSETSPTPPSG